MNQENDILKSLSGILEKKRNCIALTDAEQKLVDETYGKLFEKKFGKTHWVVKTGDEIRKEQAATDLKKADGKPAGVQPDAAIAEERSKATKKDDKIADDDSSGKIKETETGDNINVDEKRVGGKDDAQTEAQTENASDIINSKKEDLQRKPVMKFEFGDVVIKTLNKNVAVGLIVGGSEKTRVALVKWSNGTFSYTSYDSIEKLADKKNEETEREAPVSVDDSKGTKTPGTDTDKENVGVKPAATDAKVIKDAHGKQTKKDQYEAEETPAEEAAETPDQEASEQADGTENDDNEWMAGCEKAVSANPNVTDSKTICMFVRTTMKKSSEKIIKMDREEVRKSNPKLAEQMEKDGHTNLCFDTEEFKKSASGK